jgi:hypothetical protein
MKISSCLNLSRGALLEWALRNRARDGPFAVKVAVDLNAERSGSAELRKGISVEDLAN